MLVRSTLKGRWKRKRATNVESKISDLLKLIESEGSRVDVINPFDLVSK